MAVLALFGAGCGQAGAARTPSPIPTAAASRDPSRDTLPLLADVHLGASAHTFQGGDDHIGLVIENRGRDIQDLVVESPAWFAEHGLAMGTTRACGDVDLAAGSIDCGPVYAGLSGSFILRAYPEHVGTFHYEVRLADREGGALLAIAGPDGRPLVLSFGEVVDPVTNQIPGGSNPTPSP